MKSISLEVSIDAPPARVWRALCNPTEVAQWDAGNIQPVDVPSDYPQPGRHVLWRYPTGRFRILHDRPQEVVLETRLRSHLALGPYRYDETYTLSPVSVDPSAHPGPVEGRPATHMRCELIVSTHIPLVGALIERLYLVPTTRIAFEASLANLKRHCEATAEAS